MVAASSLSLDALKGMQDVPFDFGTSADVKAAFSAAADKLSGQVGSRQAARTAGAVEFKGHFSELFKTNGTTQIRDLQEIVGYLRQVVTDLAHVEDEARAENQRRATAREWAEKYAHRDTWTKVKDAFTGDDKPPSVDVGNDKGPSAVGKTPSVKQPQHPTPGSGGGGGGGTSSAIPENLKTFATTSRHLDDEVKGQPAILTGKCSEYAAKCSWGHLEAASLISGFTAWVKANGDDAQWATVVADAFAKAGGTGNVKQLSNSAITAALHSHGVQASRTDITIDPPTAYGSPPTSGYANDPINTSTGNFLENESDLGFTGPASVLAMTRTYNSMNREVGGFGEGWSSWTEAGLSFTDEAARLRLMDGRVVVFPRLGDGWDRATGENMWLAATAEGFAMTTNQGLSWTFDRAGHLLSTTQGPGTTVGFDRDGEGRVVRMRHEFGRWLELVWRDEHVSEVLTSDGRVASYRYDEHGHLVGVDAPGAGRTYRWNEQGLIEAVLDADGVLEAENTYDEQGRVVEQVSNFGRRTRFVYLTDRVTTVSDDDGTRANTWISDQRGRLVGVIDADDHRQSASYDRWGNQVMTTERDGNTTLYDYDERGRQTLQVLPSGARVSYTYDDLDRPLTVTVRQEDVESVTEYTYEGIERNPSTMRDPEGGLTRMRWSNGLLQEIVDPEGVVLRFGYDQYGELVTSTDADGNVARLERDASGRVAAAVSPLGNRTRYVYDDATGFLREQIDANGGVWRYEHTAAGRTSATIDPMGGRTEIEHGDHGETERTIDALGRAVNQRYDDLGNLASVELPDGATWQFGFNAMSRLAETTDPAGGTWRMQYDENGQLRRTVDATGVERTIETNKLGLPVSAGDALSRTTGDYDQLGRLVSVTNDDGSTSTTQYDRCGRVVSYTDEAGATTRVQRDRAGRIVAVTHPMGSTFRYEYDQCGRHVATIDTDGSRYQICYDAEGRVAGEVWPTGERVHSRFDALGNIVERYEPGRGTSTFGYDACSRMVWSNDSWYGRRRFRYDAAGQLVEAINSLGGVTRYEYDDAGRMVAMVDPMGGRIEREYDPMGRLTAETDQLGRTTRYAYDKAGRQTRRVDATGEYLEWTYDATGRLSDELVNGRLMAHTERDFAQRILRVIEHDPTAGEVTDPVVHELRWDERGNLSRRLRNGIGLSWSYDLDNRRVGFMRPDGDQTRYEYDEAGRVCAMEHRGLGRATIDRDAIGRVVSMNAPGLHAVWTWQGGQVVAHQVSRDGVTSRTEIERDEAGRVVAQTTDGVRTTYAYDAGGQLVEARSSAGSVTTYTYDANGRMTCETTDGRRSWFRYDAAGQLLSMTSPDEGVVRFGYDAGGRRVSEVGAESERRFAWDPRGFLARVTTLSHDNGRVQVAEAQRLHVDALGELAGVDGEEVFWDSASSVPVLAQFGTQAVVSYAALTGLQAGAAVQEVSERGQGWMTPDWRPRSTGADPWAASVGTGVLGGAAGGVSVGAQGGLVVAGLEWMQARVYDPGSRSFLSTDPLDGVAGAAWSGNPYSFAGNDPLNFSDPLGLRPVSDAELQSYRDANRGMLSNVYHAATNWVKHNWEYLAAGAMVVAGGVMMATGVGGPAGMALISAGISTGMQKYQHGSVNWGHVAIDGAIGLVSMGIGGAAAKGAMALTENMTSCLGRNLVVGAADGMTSGASYNALNYLTSDGPKSVGGLLKTTAAGGVSGAAIGAPLGRLTKITGSACFVADTQVLMGDGSSKAIQDVQVGDEVLAWNPATDQNEPRKVVETFVHEDVETWEVETADGQVVTSTAEHPFWVEGKGWTPVRELTAGDVLASADGSVDLVRVEATGESARVFNVHVEGLHNYHVSADDAWLRVHNSCGEETVELNPHQIRFSQNSVNDTKGVLPSMQANGWRGDPIDVVRMPDALLTTIDNTRVAVARRVGINVKAVVHDFDSIIPLTADPTRFAHPKTGIVPVTWGEAALNRIAKQSSSFRRNSPFGSFDMPRGG